MSPGYIAVSAALLAGVLLAGCGGSGTSSGPASTAFEELFIRGEALDSRLALLEATEAMPTTGTARYRGIAAFGDIPDEGAISSDPLALSSVTLTADFADSRLSGSLGDFRGSGGGVSGRMTLRDGEIVDNGFHARLDGAVDLGGGVTLDGRAMSGLFLGAGATAVAGILEGTDGAGGEVFGVFGAER